MSNAIATKHNLDFEVAEGYGTILFRIGTCHGQWGSAKGCYYILSVINDSPGNGHLEDVFEWFEYACKRDKRNLLVLECFNKGFYKHLLSKRGFVHMDAEGKNAIKVFNPEAHKKLIREGNELIAAVTLKCK